MGVISTSFVKTLGKTLCLCLVAVAMDLVWGYCGILSLGHFAFFGLGGYMIGMWLMYERTRLIVTDALTQSDIPPTPREKSSMASVTRSSASWGRASFPLIWAFADSLFLQLVLVVLDAGPFGTGLRLARLPQPGCGRLPVNPDPSDDAGTGTLSFQERQRAQGQQRAFGAAEPSRTRLLASVGCFDVVLLGIGTCPWR